MLNAFERLDCEFEPTRILLGVNDSDIRADVVAEVSRVQRISLGVVSGELGIEPFVVSAVAAICDVVENAGEANHCREPFDCWVGLDVEVVTAAGTRVVLVNAFVGVFAPAVVLAKVACLVIEARTRAAVAINPRVSGLVDKQFFCFCSVVFCFAHGYCEFDGAKRNAHSPCPFDDSGEYCIDVGTVCDFDFRLNVTGEVIDVRPPIAAELVSKRIMHCVNAFARLKERGFVVHDHPLGSVLWCDLKVAH